MSQDKEQNLQVVDFQQVREQRLEEKRRKAERIFFKSLLSVYCIVGQHKMRPIELIDVSEDGCSFQVPFDARDPWPGSEQEELPIRMYFSQDTYIPLHLRIVNRKHSIENGQRYFRFGCQVDRDTSSYAAYEQFVRFLKLYSEAAHKDMGDVTVFYL